MRQIIGRKQDLIALVRDFMPPNPDARSPSPCPKSS
jgi:hypothetical protein